MLEGADLATPLLRTLWRRAAAAARWLLLRLVSQAVALVQRGIRQGSQGAGASGSAVWGPETESGEAEGQQQRQGQQQTRDRAAGRRQRQQKQQQQDALPPQSLSPLPL